MKVLLVHPHMSVDGGAEKVVLRLAKYLNEKGMENAILTLSVSPNDNGNGNEEPHFIIPNRNFVYKVRSASFFDAIGSLREVTVLRNCVHKYVKQFDVVNVHNFPATWAVHPCQKPCVWMCNEPPDLWGNIKPSAALSMLRDLGIVYDRHVVNESVTRVCVADDFNAQRVFERYGRKPEIVPYGVDYDFFSQRGENAEIAEEYNLKDSFVLLQVGWLSPSKNQLASIKALEQVKSLIPNVKLVLAGAEVSSYGRLLREYVAGKGLKERVVFTGFLNRQRTRDLYYASDLILHPVQCQGGWLVPFEALCASKPVIVSHEMTASHIIQKEEIGLVASNLTEAVVEAHSHPERNQRMAARGKHFVQENLTWSKFGEKMLTVFEKCLENPCN